MYYRKNKLSHSGFLLFLTSMVMYCWSCNPAGSDATSELELLSLSFAEGFGVFQGNGYKVIELYKAYPSDHAPYRYLIIENEEAVVITEGYDAVIKLPVENIILTSTTQVPHLDYLDKMNLLAGFPQTDLISSPAARERIGKGKVVDLGSGAQSNVERVIELQPDWMMVSTLGDDLRNLELLKKAGIPTVLNGEYMELHPLGRAEWIKFTGALTGNYEDAEAIFAQIEADYQEAAALVPEDKEGPKVMAGVMYKDIWYVPGSDSWGSRLLQAAGGQYLFHEQKGTGSLQLNFESVLEIAKDADYWLGASDFSSLSSMSKADPRYRHFRPFHTGEIYTYTNKKGPTGGIEYFELGYLRPDLILKDLIKILHPDLLPEYSLYFYQKLNEH
jgi:iron complex transport system substrate-binding protein